MTHRTSPESRIKQRRSPASKAPLTAEDLFNRTPRFQDEYARATNLVSRMRADGLSFTQALHESGLSRATALRLVGRALRKTTKGRYVARRRDDLLRVVVMPTEHGLAEVALRDSRTASVVAMYLNAVHRYLARGDQRTLVAFTGGLIVDANDAVIEFVTNARILNELADAGMLSFESIYARTR